MSVETEKVPPVPNTTKPVDERSGYFDRAWQHWFLQVKFKVDVLNDVVQGLSQLASTGFIALDANGVPQQRTLVGTPNQIDISNGDGVAGSPTFSISATYVGQTSITTLGTIGTGTWQATPVGVAYGGTGASNAASARANLGAAKEMTATSTSATGGSATALPAQPVGYVEIEVSGTTKKIPYYDP